MAKSRKFNLKQVFLRRFRDPIRVPRISNRVPRIRENYHRVLKIRENRVPRIREVGSLQIHIGHLTFSLKKPDLKQDACCCCFWQLTSILILRLHCLTVDSTDQISWWVRTIFPTRVRGGLWMSLQGLGASKFALMPSNHRQVCFNAFALIHRQVCFNALKP